MQDIRQIETPVTGLVYQGGSVTGFHWRARDK